MKKTMMSLLALALCLMLPISCLAGSYSSTISSIHSSFVSSNRSAKSAPQQAVNGAYRCVELLEVIAYEYGVSSSTVSSIHSSFSSSNRSSKSAPQQLVNGLYRCVELLEAIAYRLDR